MSEGVRDSLGEMEIGSEALACSHVFFVALRGREGPGLVEMSF